MADGGLLVALAHPDDAIKRLDLGMVLAKRIQRIFAEIGRGGELDVLRALEVGNYPAPLIANARHPKPQRPPHADLPRLNDRVLNTESGLAS